MKDDEKWMELCDRVSKDQNREKLMALIEEVNRLLEEKKERLARQNPPPIGPAADEFDKTIVADEGHLALGSMSWLRKPKSVRDPPSQFFPVGQRHQFVQDFLQSLEPTFLIRR